MKKKGFIIVILFFPLITFCLSLHLAWAESVNSISLGTNYNSIDGDEKMFRQNLWMDKNFNAGIENLNVFEDLKDGKRLSLEGSVLSDNDYKFLLNLTKDEFGYMKLSYDQFRKYYDDSGEYHKFPRALVPSWYELDKDLYTDRSTFSLDFGLTLPDRPKYIVGYERRTKNGEMFSGLGLVRDTRGTGGTTDDDLKFVYPNSKNIDWVVDSFKAGTEFEIKKVGISLIQKFETYTNNLFGDNVYELRDNTFPAYTKVGVQEKPSYQVSTTTFLADSQVNDKFYTKGGYQFKTLQGKTKWERDYYKNSLPITVANKGARYYNGEEDSDLISNVFTWGGNLKPFKDLYLTTRLRYEKSKTNSSSQYTRDGVYYLLNYDGVVDFIQNADADVDKSGLGESIGLQYRVFPRTALYLDLDLEQTRLEYLEITRGINGSSAPTRYSWDSDVDLSRNIYTLGMNTRPLKPVFISGRYRRINKKSDFTNYADTVAGYPGWIGENSRITDEYTLRTDIKPNKFVSFNVKYQDSRTNYDVAKESANGIASADIQTVSTGVSLNPNPKFYFNTIYSVQYSMLRTKAVDAVSESQEYYNGDSASSLTTASYALNDKTTISTQYQRWVADWENAINQGLSLALERSLKQELRFKFGYSYYTYNNEDNSGINDYRANLFFVSCTGKF